MNYHRGPRWQQGAGIGSLFSGIFRGLTPVAKSAMKTILLNAANQSDSKNQKIPPSKKRKKPSPNYTAKRRRVKRQPLFDDGH